MALRYSLDLDKEAEALEKAVQSVLNDGLRTKDIMSEGKKKFLHLKWVMQLFQNCNN